MPSVFLWGSHPAALESRGYWMPGRCQEQPQAHGTSTATKGPQTLQMLCTEILNQTLKSNDGYFPRAKVFLSYISISVSISLLRLIYYLACENKIHKGLAGQALKVVWRHKHHTPVKRELQLGFIVNSPLDWLMTEQPPSTLSIWGFTAAVYKWDFHDKQLYIQFPCTSECENDLLRLCWEEVLMKTKSISGWSPPGALLWWQYKDFVLYKYFKSSSSGRKPGPPVCLPLTAPSSASQHPTPPGKDRICHQLIELPLVSHFTRPPWRYLLLSKYYKPGQDEDLINPVAFSLCAASVSSHPTSWLMQMSEPEQFLHLLGSPHSDTSKGKQTTEVWVFLFQLACKSGDESWE